jgi:hypothetical protein
MTTMIEEVEISHLSLEDAIYRLQDLENYIQNMDLKEPPKYEKEDYYYWSLDINDAWFERSLLIKRATLLLDKLEFLFLHHRNLLPKYYSKYQFLMADNQFD